MVESTLTISVVLPTRFLRKIQPSKESWLKFLIFSLSDSKSDFYAGIVGAVSFLEFLRVEIDY